jgi:hypothetical protein
MKFIQEDSFQIDCFVDAEVNIDVQPIRVEECHGLHSFDDTSVEVEVKKVYIEVGGVRIDITDRLRAEEIKAIEDSLEPNLDL